MMCSLADETQETFLDLYPVVENMERIFGPDSTACKKILYIQ